MKAEEFTPKRRLLAALAGQETDRIAWSPFLAYYWENLPQTTQQRGQLDYLLEIGADPLLRGFYSLFTPEYRNCEITDSTRGNRRSVTYTTPYGTITEGYTFSENANSWFLTDHPVKTEEDFRVLQFIYENVKLKEDYEPFHQAWKETGENGLLLALIGGMNKTPFQDLVERWCGTIDLTYALYDFPEVVEECLAVMDKVAVSAVEISVNSEAEGFIFWEDSSTTNISPAFFEKYTAPVIRKWGNIIHEHDKYLIHHACGHIRDLLPLMNDTPIDMVESISPPPTGNIDLDEAFTMLDSSKGLIGGIEPTFFENCSMKQLEERVDWLCQISKERKYILANSDSCPPGVEYEKFCAVSRMVRNMF